MSTQVPENLRYTKEHEWGEKNGDVISVGITDFAQSSLGDIVFVELPEVGKELKQDEPFGVVESIKSVSDLYSPVAGKVIEINQELADEPEKINSSPYESWMLKIQIQDSNNFESMMSAEDYKKICE